MTISDNYQPDKSSGNGVTVAFTGTWNVIAAAYMRVYWEDKTTGVQTLKVKDTHYTLSFTSSGYTVTFLPTFEPPSTVWVIRAREIEKTQTDPYRTSTGFQGAVTENSFDKVTAITQDLGENIGRALFLPLGSDPLVAMEAPNAGKGLRWNDTEDGIINSENDLDDIVDDATAQAVIATAQAAAAAASAALAVSAKNTADADVVLTHADVVLTHADVVLTHADVVLTHADVITSAASASTATTQAGIATTQASTATTQAGLAAASKTAADADVVLTHADVVLTHADVVLTHADVVTTAANVTLAAQAAGFTYKFSTNTASSDPTSGFLKFNNATLASATALYISETTNDAQAISAYLATLDDSTSTIHTKMKLYKQGAASNFVIFNITGTITDNGTWDTFTVAYVTGSGSFSNNDLLTAQFATVGDKGDTGATGAAGTVSDGDKGDITVTGSGATWTIDNSTVTLAKIANAAANSKLVGSGAAGFGAAYTELTLGTNLSFSGTTLNATGGGATSLSGLSDVLYDTGVFNMNIGSATALNAAATQNTYVGSLAGNPSGSTAATANNTFMGRNSGGSLTSGSANTGIGVIALNSVTTATNNTAIGSSAGGNLTGSSNTAIGQSALSTLTTGSSCTALGRAANVSAAGSANRTAIGAASSCTVDNSVQLGDSSVTVVTCGTSNTASVFALNTAKMYIKTTGATGSRVNAASFNVSSITDTGVGDYSFVTTTNFANTNYAIFFSSELTATTYAVALDRRIFVRNGGQSASTIRVNCIDQTAGTNLVKDPTATHCVAFGTQ